jgi:hypothetical protein
MAIKTTRSTAEELKARLGQAEEAKKKLLNTITKEEFLKYAPLEKEEFKEMLEIIAEALDSMYDPIQRQKTKIADEIRYLSKANQEKMKGINAKLFEQLRHIPLIKGALVDRDIQKIKDGLLSLKKEVSECLALIKSIEEKE